MRGAAALGTAVLLALALLAAGCGLVDSLTPFGVGTQDYSSGNAEVNGLWVGTSDGGGSVTFQIGSDRVSQITLNHVDAACTIKFEALALVEPIVDNVFTVEIILDQGRTVITGRFTSATSSSGGYFFEGLPAGLCPSSGTGTFTAEKTSL